ncbi:MAG: hypothetical protein FGM15_09995 [Chthoniobacterales bacterium]|nr:hypothetical protein [Chthoniobacterales bacterium]
MASFGRLVLAGCLTITLAGNAAAQSRSSLTDRDSGDAAKTARLNEQLLLARESIRSLTESLALANSEAEVFKRQAEDLQAKFDALAPGSKSDGDIEERLLSTVNELTRQQKENALLLERLLGLAESVQVFLKSVETSDNDDGDAFIRKLEAKAAQKSDAVAGAEAKELLETIKRNQTAQAEARASLESELRAADRMLGVGATDDLDAQAARATLTDAAVVEVKPEFALVVANIGREAGVKIGMPFQVWRDNRRVGEVRVIDVRDRISGAVIQNLVSEEDPIKTGDRLRVDTRR